MIWEFWIPTANTWRFSTVVMKFEGTASFLFEPYVNFCNKQLIARWEGESDCTSEKKFNPIQAIPNKIAILLELDKKFSTKEIHYVPPFAPLWHNCFELYGWLQVFVNCLNTSKIKPCFSLKNVSKLQQVYITDPL